MPAVNSWTGLSLSCFFPTIWRPVWVKYVRSFISKPFVVYIQLERRARLALCYWSAGTDLVVLYNFSAAFRRRNRLSFFLVFFLLFFLCQFLSHFLDVFFASLPSLTHSCPHSLLQTRGNDHLFCFRPFVRLFCVLGLRKRTGCFVVWKTLHWLTF